MKKNFAAATATMVMLGGAVGLSACGSGADAPAPDGAVSASTISSSSTPSSASTTPSHAGTGSEQSAGGADPAPHPTQGNQVQPRPATPPDQVPDPKLPQPDTPWRGEAPPNAKHPGVKGKTIERCGDPHVDKRGTSYFTDGTRGFTKECAEHMDRQWQQRNSG